MKYFLFVSVFFSFTLFSQEGYKLIEKAEKKYAKAKYEQALSLLDIADTMDYGFCGNAWWSASESINTLRAKIYIEEAEYSLARTYLDSIFTLQNLNIGDSLRWKSYQLQFGKDSLANMIDSSLNNIILIDSGFFKYVYIPLSNGQNEAVFTISREILRNYKGSKEESLEQLKLYWIEEFKKSILYSMIKNDSE